MHHWWSCELIQPFWKAIWNYAQRALKDCLPFDPERDHREKDLNKNIYSCALCGGKKLENKGMSFDWGITEQIVVSVGDGIVLCSKE